MDDERIDQQRRVDDAERAAAPWWRVSRFTALLNLALALVVLIVVLVVLFDDGTLIDRAGFLTLGAAVVTPFAAVAVLVSAAATVLIGTRSTAGLVSLTCYGVLVAAVLAQWLLVLFDEHAPGTGAPMLVLSFAVCAAAVAAAVVGAASLGRTMRVTKARRAIGVRRF